MTQQTGGETEDDDDDDSREVDEDDDEDEDADEIWTVTEEQREYYTKHFKTMQTDLTAMISG